MIDQAQRNRRVLSEAAPREAAALLLRQAASITFEASRILGQAGVRLEVKSETLPNPEAAALLGLRGQTDRLQLAIDDVVAQLERDARTSGRTTPWWRRRTRTTMSDIDTTGLATLRAEVERLRTDLAEARADGQRSARSIDLYLSTLAKVYLAIEPEAEARAHAERCQGSRRPPGEVTS